MLKTKHFFPFVKMIKALDLKDAFKEMYEKAKGKSEEELSKLDQSGEGIDYLFILIDKLPQAEKETYHFLQVYTDKTKEEIENMDLDEVIAILREVLEDEKFKVFFQQAMK
jgi:hypothetical protein